MEFLFFFFFSYLLFFFFHKKLLLLLILEGFMIFIIFFYGFLFSNSIFSSYFLFLFSVFMVVDSVFGVSLLILSSRDSSLYSSLYSYF